MNKRILIAEDDTSIQELLTEYLEHEGFEVTPTNNGQEALDALNSGTIPFLIILDYMMPVMDGPAFLKARAKDDKFKKIPVMYCTGKVSVTIEHENVTHITKPFDLNTLIDHVNHAFQRQSSA
jgi:two-component system phosphate regulon response regulator PhoB